jgi:hypothetical protein
MRRVCAAAERDQVREFFHNSAAQVGSIARVSLVVSGALIAAACGSESQDSVETIAQAIAGGARPRDRQFPATVFWDAGRGPSGPRYCSGSRIGKNAILTAAHCVAWGEMTRGTPVRVSNAANTKEPAAVFAKLLLRQAWVHPSMAAAIATGMTRDDFEDAEAMKRVLPDLAVLEFDAAIADTMPGIARAEVDAAEVAIGDTITLSGYGCVDLAAPADGRPSFGETRVLSSADAKAPSTVAGLLRGGPVNAGDEKVFDTASPGYFFNAAGGVLGSQGPLTCVGDSGGPVYRDGKIVGVNSFRFMIPDRLPNGTTALLWGVGIMPRLSDSGGFTTATWLKTLIGESDLRAVPDPPVAAAPGNPPAVPPAPIDAGSAAEVPAATAPATGTKEPAGCSESGRSQRGGFGSHHAFTGMLALIAAALRSRRRPS